MHNTNVEKKKLKNGIQGLEVRWCNRQHVRFDDADFQYPKTDNTKHTAGVDKSIKDSVMEFVPIWERVLLLRFQTDFRPLNFIQVYISSVGKYDEEIEEFYGRIKFWSLVNAHHKFTAKRSEETVALILVTLLRLKRVTPEYLHRNSHNIDNRCRFPIFFDSHFQW